MLCSLMRGVRASRLRPHMVPILLNLASSPLENPDAAPCKPMTLYNPYIIPSYPSTLPLYNPILYPLVPFFLIPRHVQVVWPVRIYFISTLSSTENHPRKCCAYVHVTEQMCICMYTPRPCSSPGNKVCIFRG